VAKIDDDKAMLFLANKSSCGKSRTISGRPRPLEVKASKVTGYINNFTNEKE
jgi:hypothetical protein